MITLESTKQAFEAWRKSRRNENTPTPTELWDMVNQLLPSHKRSEICKVLRISSNQIKTHCLATDVDYGLAAMQSSSNNFVEATPTPTTNSMSELTIKGKSKSLHLCLPTAALSEVLPMLGGLL